MMFAKTVCNNPGSYVEVVPIGLVARLQYNKDGLIEKVFTGFDSTVEPISLNDFKAVRQYIPNKVMATGGTTWVDGVFYSDTLSTVSGSLPECTSADYLSRMNAGEDFKFFGGHVESLAVSLSGVLAVRNWLQISKFEVLPGSVVPYEMTDDTIKMMIDHGTYHFKYPYIAGFMVYNGPNYNYIPSGLCQSTAKSVSKKLDEYGYVKCTVKTDDGKSMVLNYSDVVTFDIQTATSILYYDAEGPINILASCKTDTKIRDKYSRTFTCPVCKKQYIIPESGLVQCDDENCASRMYPNVQRMLSTLRLPEMSVNRFKEVLEDNSVTCLTDILYLPEYKDRKLSATLAEAIKSVTPATVCADESFFSKFANTCSNSVDTVMYYAQNPLRIQTDLNINSVQGRQFVTWIQEPGNILTLQTILTAVTIEARTKKFDGAPIFRNKSFVLTGRFRHGSYSDIRSILESYSGTVYADVEPNLPDSVIIGSIKEDVDGNIIQRARFAGVPIFEEDDFFAWNNIDADLKANLL